MNYCIKRETLIPWEKSISAITVQGDIFDIVESHKNTGLDSVAEYIIDNQVIIKRPIADNQINDFIAAYENQTGTVLQELLLG